MTNSVADKTSVAASPAVKRERPTMVRLSRKTLFAVEAVLDIAYNGRVEPVQAKEITARQGVPNRYLEQVMQQLVHEGVLKGVRGPRGGYVLAKERRRVTVGEIVRIVSAMDNTDENEPISRARLGSDIVAPLWEEAQKVFLESLDAVTIDDLCRCAADQGVPREGPESPDFTI